MVPAFFIMLGVFTNSEAGQYHHRNCHSSNHRSIPRPQRRRLVWKRIPPHHLRIPTHFRQALHLLLHKMGLHGRAGYFRSRFLDLRCLSEFDCAHRRPCGCWFGICRHLLRRRSDHRQNRSFASTTRIHWDYWRNVWHCERCRTIDGRCIHRQRQAHLEMVFLHQLALRRCHCRLYHFLFAGPQAEDEEEDDDGTNRSIRPTRHDMLSTWRNHFVACPSVGRQHLPLAQRPSHRSVHHLRPLTD